jgi:hypothetical protein
MTDSLVCSLIQDKTRLAMHKDPLGSNGVGNFHENRANMQLDYIWWRREYCFWGPSGAPMASSMRVCRSIEECSRGLDCSHRRVRSRSGINSPIATGVLLKLRSFNPHPCHTPSIQLLIALIVNNVSTSLRIRQSRSAYGRLQESEYTLVESVKKFVNSHKMYDCAECAKNVQ